MPYAGRHPGKVFEDELSRLISEVFDLHRCLRAADSPIPCFAIEPLACSKSGSIPMTSGTNVSRNELRTHSYWFSQSQYERKRWLGLSEQLRAFR